MSAEEKCYDRRTFAGDKVEMRPTYRKPDITTYTSDELEDIIGPALTGS